MTTLRLSATEVARLGRATELLVAPLEHATIDEWRGAVNRALRELIGADSAGFLLPGTDGPLLFSEEHDPAQLARYPDLSPPPLADGRNIWERLIEASVSTMPIAYGAHVDRYLESAYYNEYAAPNGAADTLCAMLPLGGADPRHVASVQLWRERTTRRRFAERDRTLMMLLMPALRVGVELITRWHSRRAELASVLDSLDQAVLASTPDGVDVAETRALTAMLAADVDAASIRSALLRSKAAAATLHTPTFDSTGRALHFDIQTRLARYRIRSCVLLDPRPIVLSMVERLTPAPPSPESLREQFGLTRAEVRVALLLADGCSNDTVATRLGISPFTARRHTERVLRKLGVSSRAAVAARIRR